MKAILFVFSLLFSVTAFPATFEGLNGGVNRPLGDVIGGCSSDSCFLTYLSPEYLGSHPEYIDNPYNGEDGFSDGEDLYARDMGMGFTYMTYETIDILVEWEHYDTYNSSIFYSSRTTGEMEESVPGTSTNSLILSLLAGDQFSIGIDGLANSKDSWLGYRFTAIRPPSEVPLPASLFLLAPALLGFMGLKRKAKSS